MDGKNGNAGMPGAERLAGLLSKAKDRCSNADDYKALEAAISFLSAAADGGVTDELDLKDLLFDYKLSAEQNDKMLRKFCRPEMARMKGDECLCPECGRRVGIRHTHCHWCGKKLAW